MLEQNNLSGLGFEISGLVIPLPVCDQDYTRLPDFIKCYMVDLKMTLLYHYSDLYCDIILCF